MVSTTVATLLSPLLQAETVTKGIRFQHHDWELACDNTRTCRAAGYQSDADELTISLLLTRQAGAGQPVTAEVMLGQDYSESAGVADFIRRGQPLTLQINGQSWGAVTIDPEPGASRLSNAQIGALLVALQGDSNIEFHGDRQRWRLSDQGATAVLLKMDVYQGRVGTPGAIVKKGQRNENDVLPALPLPIVIQAALAEPPPGDERLPDNLPEGLLDGLRASIGEDDCPRLGEENIELSIERLSASKLLLAAPCWRGAYNFGAGFWVVDNTLSKAPELVTSSENNHQNGTIRAFHKGRGIGDCWSLDEWTWNGERFVHSKSATTGMCKEVAAGGAWELPTLVTTIRKP